MLRSLFTIIFTSYCILTHAQYQVDTQRSAQQSKNALGIALGVANYYHAYILSGSDAFSTPAVTVEYVYRPRLHFQIGASGDIGRNFSGHYGGSVAFNMSFPIGKGPVYFYPGWHIRYASTTYGDLAGLGIQLGVCAEVTPLISINVETNGSLMLIGTRTDIHTGVRFNL